MNATCPGLLSVGTRLCETPDAPRSGTVNLEYGATGPAELRGAGNAPYDNAKSALKTVSQPCVTDTDQPSHRPRIS